MADRPRIVLQFRECDFRHRKALEILQEHARGKTDLVVNALLHYISCPEAQSEFSKEHLREIVREVIQEMQSEGAFGEPLHTRSESNDLSVLADVEELGALMSAFRGR